MTYNLPIDTLIHLIVRCWLCGQIPIGLDLAAVNGWTYTINNFQHAGDWEKPVHDKVRDTLDPLIRASYKDRFGSAVGYLTADAVGIKI